MMEFFEKIGEAVIRFFYGLNGEQFLQSLIYMLYGLGGIFIVVLIIFLVIFVLNKIPAGNKEDSSEE